MGGIAAYAQSIAGFEAVIFPAGTSPAGRRRTLRHPVGNGSIIIRYVQINDYVGISEAKLFYHAIYGD